MRQFLSILVIAFGLCSPAFAGQDLDALRAKAEHGDPNAQYNVGVIHAKGDGTPREDAEAIKWYRKAAEWEDVRAQYKLGLMYAQGQGVPRDYMTAYMWISRAAARGFEPDQKILDILATALTAEQRAEAQRMAFAPVDFAPLHYSDLPVGCGDWQQE